MPDSPVTATAGANIAFIKYWGNQGRGANLPLNPSISMTLADCSTRTTAQLLPGAETDDILLEDRLPPQKSLRRLTAFLDFIRALAQRSEKLRVRSQNSFPTACGIASSASGFAALATAATAAYGLAPDPVELSRIARMGSGSAARSVMGGFVALHCGDTHETACAEQIAPETAWPRLRDLIVVVSRDEKPVSSAEGHRLARTSEMLAARLQAVTQRAQHVRRAIINNDLAALGRAAEADALSMHAVMMTSSPPLLYWSPHTLEMIQYVWDLRSDGIQAWFTIDAGPNLHIITSQEHLPAIEKRIHDDFGWHTIADRPGPGARIVEADPQ